MDGEMAHGEGSSHRMILGEGSSDNGTMNYIVISRGEGLTQGTDQGVPRLEGQGRNDNVDGEVEQGKGSSHRMILEGSSDNGIMNYTVISRGEGLTQVTDQGLPRFESQGRDENNQEPASCSRTKQVLHGGSGEIYVKEKLKRHRNRKRRYSSSDSSSSGRCERRGNRRRDERRSNRRKRRYRSSSKTEDELSRPTKNTSIASKDSNTNLMLDKFLSILNQVKSSDKPKMNFNTNVIPEFDPMSKGQSVLNWLTKVEECSEIYGWDEKETIHYSLPKLSGVAKDWYQGLPTLLHTWSEWKTKLIESFPCREDYAELLTDIIEES